VVAEARTANDCRRFWVEWKGRDWRDGEMRVGVKEEEAGVWKMVFVEQFKAIVLIDRGFYFLVLGVMGFL